MDKPFTAQKSIPRKRGKINDYNQNSLTLDNYLNRHVDKKTIIFSKKKFHLLLLYQGNSKLPETLFNAVHCWLARTIGQKNLPQTRFKSQ